MMSMATPHAPASGAAGRASGFQWLTIHGRRVGLGSAELVKLADARRIAARTTVPSHAPAVIPGLKVPTFAAVEAACFAERR